MVVPRLAGEGANGAVVDHRPFRLGCSLPALDAAARSVYLALVCLRLGDPIVLNATINSEGRLPAIAQFVVMYKTPKDPAAFDEHCTERRVQIAKKIPGLRKYGISQSEGSEGAPRCMGCRWRLPKLAPTRHPAISDIGPLLGLKETCPQLASCRPIKLAGEAMKRRALNSGDFAF